MSHDPFDDLLQTLSSPARADELANEAEAVESMRSWLQRSDVKEPTTVHASSSRRARVATLVAAAVIGFGGVAAAGPGKFLPSSDGPSFIDMPETPPTSATTATTETTATTTPATTATTTPATTTTTTTEGTTTTTGAPTLEDLAAAAVPLVDDPDTAFDETMCAEGNHGETVSSVAQATEPGPDHGPTVRDAAQSSCGKDAAGDETLAADDADDDGEGGKPDHAGKPDSTGKPDRTGKAEPGSRGRGNAQNDD
jgi:multidrug efflux pump subunit AcrB